MNVYVETNFVLELALQQEQHAACEAILEMGRAGAIGLVLPAYCLVEPFETLGRNRRRRRALMEELDRELTQLARSPLYAREFPALDPRSMGSFLVRSSTEETTRLEATRADLLQVARIIPLDAGVLAAAQARQAESDLPPQDAVVYASVLQHLDQVPPAPSCFLTRNSKDFGDSQITDTLETLRCKVLFDFDRGRQYVESRCGA